MRFCEVKRGDVWSGVRSDPVQYGTVRSGKVRGMVSSGAMWNGLVRQG